MVGWHLCFFEPTAKGLLCGDWLISDCRNVASARDKMNVIVYFLSVGVYGKNGPWCCLDSVTAGEKTEAQKNFDTLSKKQ